MAGNADQQVSGNPLKLDVAAKLEIPLNFQQILPLWCSKNENTPVHGARHAENVRQKAFGDGDVKCIDGDSPDDAEDESELELSLGLSLGGCRSKSKNELREGNESDQRSGEITKDVKDNELTRRLTELGKSRSQPSWEGFLVSRNIVKEEKVGSPISDAHLPDRHVQRHSAHPTPITSLSSLCSSTIRRLSSHVALADTWCSLGNSRGEESKAASADQFREAAQENDTQGAQVDAKDQDAVVQNQSGVPNQAVATSARGRAAEQLLDRLKDDGECAPRSVLSSMGKKSPAQSGSASYPIQPHGGANSLQASGNAATLGQQSGKGDVRQQHDGIGKGEACSEDDCMKAADDQQQRQVQDAMEQQKKQRRQEARKKRKALLEEQKLQKKAKKDDDCRVGNGLSLKQLHQTTRPSTAASGSKVSSTGPLPATSREVSSGTREVSSPPDSQDGGSTNSGFRRTSSGVRQHGGVWDGAATSSPEKRAHDSGLSNETDDVKQLHEIRSTLQRERERMAKDKGRELEKESGPKKNECERRRSPVESGHQQTYKGEDLPKLYSGADHAGHDAFGPGALGVNGVEVNKVHMSAPWLQTMTEMQRNSFGADPMAELLDNKETLKKSRDISGGQKGSVLSTAERERAKASDQPAADQAELNEESRDIEALKAEKGSRADPAPCGSLLTSSSMSAMGSFPQAPTFPLLHLPYPFPVCPDGVPFSLAYPFPYLMQFAPSIDAALSHDHSCMAVRSLQVSSDLARTVLPIPADLSANWTSPVYVQATPPHSTARSLARTLSGFGEEDGWSLQGIKSNENLTTTTSLSKQVSPIYSSFSLPRALSLGSGNVQGGSSGKLPSLPSPPQFGPLRTRSDSGEVFFGQDSNSAFASLVAAVEASQGLSAAVASVSVGVNLPSSGPAGRVSRFDRASPRRQLSAHEDMIGVTSSSKAVCEREQSLPEFSGTLKSQEEGERHQGNRFRQGTTRTIATTEVLINHIGQEASSLKLGIAEGQLFGGSGSSPDLPWVTCTGAGPTGKTISGVLYIYKKDQVGIVCACHGSHMSAGEFVQHAGRLDLSNPEKNIVVGPFSLGSPAASAHS